MRPLIQIPVNFIGRYAATNMWEDAAESFAHFVLLDQRPEGKDVKEKKILLFYDDPQMLKIREDIRSRIPGIKIQ